MVGKLISALCWQEVAFSRHLLPLLHSVGAIVFLFIYFTIDFSVETDMALIHSDWLS